MTLNELATVMMNESVWNNFVLVIILLVIVVSAISLIWKIRDLTNKIEDLDNYVRYLEFRENHKYYKKENE